MRIPKEFFLKEDAYYNIPKVRGNYQLPSFFIRKRNKSKTLFKATLLAFGHYNGVPKGIQGKL